MKHLIWALPLATFAVVGCEAVTQFVEDPGVSVVAQLDVNEPAGRRVLQASGAWTAADIQAVRITLYRADASNDVQLASQELFGTDINSVITFSSLKRNTNYKITAEAWADQAKTTQIDTLSTSPPSCTTSFATTTTSPVQLGGIKLTLQNTGYSGSSNGVTLDVIDGTVEDPTGTETITVEPPASGS